MPGQAAASSLCGAQHQVAQCCLGTWPQRDACQARLCPCSWRGTAGTSLEQPRVVLLGCARCQLPTNARGPRGAGAPAQAAISPWLSSGQVSCAVLQHPHTAALVPCVLGTLVPWAWPGCAVRSQQLRSHSYEVLHLVALHQILMALQHSQGLSIMGLSIILPCLSSLYFSCPAPLLFHKPAAPAQPAFQVLGVQTQSQEGLWDSQATFLYFAHGLFGWLLPLIQAPWLSPPVLILPCCGIHAALCLLPAPSTLVPCRSLYFRSHHPMVSHGQTQAISAYGNGNV